MPFIASDGRVSYASPAASADSMFWSEPSTLKRPIGMMTDRYGTRCPPPSDANRSPKTGTGRWNAAASGLAPTGARPVIQARSVPTPTATRPPGRRPLNRTRPK